MMKQIEDIGCRRNERSIYVKSFIHSSDSDFTREAIELVKTANDICLVGSCLNFLWDSTHVELLIDQAMNRGAKISICLANPQAKLVTLRRLEEKTGEGTAPIGRHREAIATVWRMIEEAGSPNGIELRLCDHCPTFAALLFDNNYYIYPYGYKRLGTQSPLFHFVNDGSEEVCFFKDVVDRIIDDAMPAAGIVEKWGEARA